MRTTFGSFNIATSGLFASQRALDVTSHNVSNANTEGYSRQISLQRATLPMVGDPTGVVGTGVETYDVQRIRSEYLDHKFWSQNKTYAEWGAKESTLGELEGIFNEPSDTGIRQVMDDFFSSLEELSKKPSDSTCRVAVIEKANILTASINRNGHEIASAIRDLDFDVKNKVEQINSLSQRIVNLNKQIFTSELDGHMANDLRDQRGVLLDQLSSIVNIDVSEIPGENGNKYLDVKIGGMTLIDHYNYNKLTTVDVSDNNAQKNGLTDLGAGEISKVVWADTPSQEVRIDGGELKGLIDLRDGDGQGMNYRGLPYYLNKLNEFAMGFAEGFNTQHKAGVDLNGNTGQNFFNVPAGDELINCINFKVNPDIVANPNLLAASSNADGESNNENVTKLVEYRQRNDIFDNSTGTADDFIKSLLSALSVDSSQAKRMTANSESLVQQTNIRRMSDSGVSLDEEMTNMVKFQQAYSASARLITTLDKILDTTIRGMGLVGR